MCAMLKKDDVWVMVIHPINNGNPEKIVSSPLFDGLMIIPLCGLMQLLTVAYVGSGPAFPCPMHASAADHMNRVIQARTQMPHIAWWHSPNITLCWKGLIYLIL